METLTAIERSELAQLLTGHSALFTAIEKMARILKQRMDANCSSVMASVPRNTELAADYAAKAEAYKLLLTDFERFLNAE